MNLQLSDYDASAVLSNKSIQEANKSERAACKKELSKLKAKLYAAHTLLTVYSRALNKLKLLEKKSLDKSLDLYIQISQLQESMRNI